MGQIVRAAGLVLLVACDGGNATDDGGADASSEIAPEASPDVVIDVAPEAARDAVADVKQDTGIPPLTCSGDGPEPNEKEVLASYLGAIDDCDSSGSFYTDVSAGKGDTDWYRFRGNDTFGCSVNPTLTIDAPGLRLCAFALCVDGATTIQSCSGGSSATSPAGIDGCCTTSTTSMALQVNCTGIDDSTDIFIRVDQLSSNQCVPYDVDYHY